MRLCMRAIEWNAAVGIFREICGSVSASRAHCNADSERVCNCNRDALQALTGGLTDRL
jgi:hypothetical protein